MDLGLSDKVALIIGGADGLGAATARVLAQEGTAVVVADVNHERAVSLARELGPRSRAVACDVQSRTEIEAAVDAATGRFGGLHILVHAVGLTLPDWLEDLDERDVETTFAVNMRSALWAVRAAAGPMRQGGFGRIIILGSGSAMKGSAGLTLYSASKFFLRGLAQAAGLELGPSGITVNMVCPSDIFPEGDRPSGSWRNQKLIRISCQKEGVPDLPSLRDKRAARTPLRRACSAQDVADAIAFLASPRAGFITAQTIGITGGLLPT